ncbi:MAG: hypothetical protein AAGI68_14480 [Planctomycetota bacterium]
MDRAAVTNRDFLDARAALLDVAAFLDRVDRAGGEDDFRVTALRAATTLLNDGDTERARRILEHLSDPTAGPIERAPSKGAAGAYDPESA